MQPAPSTPFTQPVPFNSPSLETSLLLLLTANARRGSPVRRALPDQQPPVTIATATSHTLSYTHSHQCPRHYGQNIYPTLFLSPSPAPQPFSSRAISLTLDHCDSRFILSLSPWTNLLTRLPRLPTASVTHLSHLLYLCLTPCPQLIFKYVLPSKQLMTHALLK